MLRHLPPTATPISVRTVAGALRPSPNAIARFEDEFSLYQGVSPCFTAASGRTALHLLLAALKRVHGEERDEVIMPAYTCPAVAKVALAVGLSPRLVDMSPATFGLDLAELDEALSHRTLAVMHVHPFGIPVEIETVLAAAGRYSAFVIEDAAQSMGARLGGRAVGSLGHFGLYSLGPGKPISCGGGGIVSVNRADSAHEVTESWRTLAETSEPSSTLAFLRLAAFTTAFHPTGWWLATKAGAHNVGNHEAAQGYAMASLSEGQATVALEQLARLDAINRVRRSNAGALIERLGQWQSLTFPGIRLRSGHSDQSRHDWQPAAPNAEPIFLRLPLLTPDREQRDLLFDRLWSAGIGVGKMYRRPLNEIFPQLSAGALPNAGQIAARLLTIPTHHFLRDRDIERIADIAASLNLG